MITRCQPLLGTFVEITAPAEAGAAISAAFAVIRHVHARMSFHEDTSDLALIRRADPGEVIEVDRETVAVLRVANALHEATDGLFDVTMGRELVRAGFLPRMDVAHLARFSGNTGDLDIVDDTHLRCRRPLLVDLGGIAKGHAVDRSVETLVGAGVAHGVVNAGGDLRLFGDQDWPVHLRDAEGRMGAPRLMSDCAVASSANLLNRRRHRGQDVSPHFDRDRRPVLSDHAVTVVADRCVIADAMTKVALADVALANRILAAHRGFVLSRQLPRMAA
ncbi:MAG: FAD:protein FMN transferase [Sphingobium sp.]|nr:FAD:protein FMN transferase [Sphingobium sp.]